MAQSPMESYCLFGQTTQTLQSRRRVDEEKVKKLKAVRKHLPTSVRLMIEDPCIGNDFIDNAVEVIFRSGMYIPYAVPWRVKMLCRVVLLWVVYF